MATSTAGRQISGGLVRFFCAVCCPLLLTALAACASPNRGSGAVETRAPSVQPGPSALVVTRDVTIVDRDVAFLGGMNIGREYRFDWHDLMVRVEGTVVEELARDYDDAWAKSGMLGDLAAFFRYFSGSNPSMSEGGYPVRILYTRPQHSQIYEAQLAAIRRARNYIYIENPYFSDDAILFELIAARRRGVDVRFVIAEKGDAMLMDMSNVQAINTMLANGIRVYVYPGMTHVKAAIVDDWIMVGSANLDKLSMRVNIEISIATSHPEAVNALKERPFDVDFEKSLELSEQLPAGPGYYLAEAVADIFM